MLSTINTMLTDLMGPAGPLIAVGGLALVLIGITLPIMLNRKAEPFDKLKAQRTQSAAAKPGNTLRTARKVDKLEKYATFLEPQSEAELSA